MFKKKLRTLRLLSVVGIFFFTLLVSVFAVNVLREQRADAAEVLTAVAADYNLSLDSDFKAVIGPDEYTLKWIDAAHLELTFKSKAGVSVMFVPKDSIKDQRNSSDDVEYVIKGWPANCYSRATAGKSINTPLNEIDIDIDFKASPAGGCTNTSPNEISNVTAANASTNSIAYFSWVDSGTIKYVDDSEELIFVQKDPAGFPNLFSLSSEDGVDCQDKLLLSANKATVRYFELDNDFNGDAPPEILPGNGCGYREPTAATLVSAPLNNDPIPLANTSAATLPAGSGSTSPIGGTGDGSQNVDCDASGSNLSWALCPIIDGSLNGAEAIFHSFIEPYLQTSPLSTDTSSDPSKNPVLYTWKAFRTIGNIVLVFALLIVVFGQSIGGGLVDAYTAKKTIPRILIAAILINLSIYICAVMIDIFNVLGAGLARLIISPLKDVGELKVQPEGGSGFILGITSILAIAVATIFLAFAKSGPTTNGGGVLGSVLLYVLVFVLVPIFLAAFSIFLTLIIRRGIIMALVIISPIALATLAIPNADKYAKKWFDAFIKTLMVYPIITGIFGISQVLAVVTYAAGDSTQVRTIIATLIIAFAPLFMIPFAFKLAGGVIGGLANVVKSGRDNLKKTWGDDKHNPYSARNRLKKSAGEGIAHRAVSGAGHSNKRTLDWMSNYSSSLRGAQAQAAGTRASKAVDGIAEEQRSKFGKVVDMDATKSAASKAATKAKSSGLTNEQSDVVGKSAALGSIYTQNDHPGLSTDQVEKAAGWTASGTIQALQDGHLEPAAIAAGNQTRLAAINGGYSPQEISAIGKSAAEVHKATGGSATQAQYDAARDATVRAQRASRASGDSPAKTQAVSKASGIAAAKMIGTDTNPSTPSAATSARAVIAGDSVAASAGLAHDIGMTPSVPGGDPQPVAKIERAVQAAADATYSAVEANPSATAGPAEKAAYLNAGRTAATTSYSTP